MSVLSEFLDPSIDVTIIGYAHLHAGCVQSFSAPDLLNRKLQRCRPLFISAFCHIAL